MLVDQEGVVEDVGGKVRDPFVPSDVAFASFVTIQWTKSAPPEAALSSPPSETFVVFRTASKY